MKFNRVNKDKLQIILTKEDMQAHNISKWEFLPQNPQAQKVFQDILEKAYDECGFAVEYDTQLMIEAFPITAESVLITVTKLDSRSLRKSLEKELANLSGHISEAAAYIEFNGEEDIDDMDLDLDLDLDHILRETVYCFDDMEAVIELSKLVKELYHGESTLYKYREKFFLFLHQQDLLSQDANGFFKEYGITMHLSQGFLEEHGEKIIKQEAISRLASL